MQLHNIAKSLRAITNATPALSALLPGELHYGSRATPTVAMPYGLLDVREVADEENTSGVRLVTYEATLTVVVHELVEQASGILDTFHSYWDRIASLPALVATEAKLVMIHSGSVSEAGEVEQGDLGADIVAASSVWTIQLSEYLTELTL